MPVVLEAPPADASPREPAKEEKPSVSPGFPPAAFPPAYPRTAQAGDGVWVSYLPGATGEPPLAVRTIVHASATRPDVYAAIVALDLGRASIHLVAGTAEPVSKEVPKDHRTGLVPDADLPDLLVVHNGGFMAKHGAWGMKVGADRFLPPREDACVVALFEERAVRIGPWEKCEGDVEQASAYRQTPPCLVEDGHKNPLLLAEGQTKPWGAAEGGKKDIRRSAMGLTADGRTLLYALGEWITASELADALVLASAANAAELDVNWSYTRFMVYGHGAPGGPPQVIGTLVPKLKHAPGQYVSKPSERDFFYWKWRR